MKKAECERVLRHLCHEWRRETGKQEVPAIELSHTEFMGWVRARNPELIKFRSVMPVSDEVERWFAQEFKITWAY
jgi:hypothetical protein